MIYAAVRIIINAVGETLIFLKTSDRVFPRTNTQSYDKQTLRGNMYNTYFIKKKKTPFFF